MVAQSADARADVGPGHRVRKKRFSNRWVASCSAGIKLVLELRNLSVIYTYCLYASHAKWRGVRIVKEAGRAFELACFVLSERYTLTLTHAHGPISRHREFSWGSWYVFDDRRPEPSGNRPKGGPLFELRPAVAHYWLHTI